MEENKKNDNLIKTFEIIDSLDKNAFRFIIERLYEHMDYEVLRIHNIRKVDLKEWFANIFNYVNERVGEPYKLYLQVLKERIQIYNCGSYLRAKNYQNHAIATITMPNNSIEDIKDAFLIYNALKRAAIEYSNNQETIFELVITKDDADLHQFKNFSFSNRRNGKKREKNDLIYKAYTNVILNTNKLFLHKLIFFYDFLLLTLVLQDRGLL